MLARKTRKNLYDTTLETFWDVANNIYGLREGIDYVFQDQKGRITFSNGSFIYLAELKRIPKDPYYTRYGGYELTDCFIDEVGEIPEKSLEAITSRVRYKLIDNCKKVLCAGNPLPNWSKGRWVTTRLNKKVKLKPHQRVKLAMLSSNPNKEFVESYRRNLEQLPFEERARLLDGRWDIITNELPFFNEFKLTRDVRESLIAEDYETLLAFDFNYNPTSALEVQMTDEGIKFIKEHEANGGTQKILPKLEYLKERFMKITGDNSGHSGSSASGSDTDFKQIEEYFGQSVDKITYKANAKHKHSRRICNGAFFLGLVQISEEGCPILIQEILTAQATPDGGLLKDDDANRNDKVDTFRYAMNYFFATYEDLVLYKKRLEAIKQEKNELPK